jgi:hypothetical protein
MAGSMLELAVDRYVHKLYGTVYTPLFRIMGAIRELVFKEWLDHSFSLPLECSQLGHNSAPARSSPMYHVIDRRNSASHRRAFPASRATLLRAARLPLPQQPCRSAALRLVQTINRAHGWDAGAAAIVAAVSPGSSRGGRRTVARQRLPTRRSSLTWGA